MSNTTVSAASMSRRGFVVGTAAASAGFTLGFHLPSAQAQTAARKPEVNAWVVIKPDDTVVVRIARSEMGQGTLTGLAQLVAEELECDWSKVTTEYPTPGQNLARNRVWGNFSTGGSRGIRESQDYVRKGGAAARMMLVSAAAQQWGVPAAECKAAMSKVTHAASGRSASYGQLADAAAKIEPPKEIALKDPKTWTIAGKPLKRLDTADKLNGKLVYGADLALPGMLSAAIVDCPVFGGKVKSFDAAAVMSMPGVKKVVPVGASAVAVVADTWWRAKSALAKLPINWDEGPNANVSSATIDAMLTEGLSAAEAAIGNRSGDAKAAIAGAAKVIEATYSYPYQNHACMEPMNATALYTPGKCEVWCPTQNGEAALAAAAAASGLPVAQCEVYKLHLGGGFGRRGAVHDYVTQAVTIAKAMPGVPVKLLWSREEDMLHGRYHPVTKAKLVGGLDANGNLVGFQMRLSGQSILAGVAPQNMQGGVDRVAFQGLAPEGDAAFGYTIPNLLIDYAMRNSHVPPGFWRGVNANHNAIYVECFIDELAKAAGKDPLVFRREIMAKNPKNLAVLNAVAAKVGWDTPAPQGIFRGLSQIMAFGSYTAACAEISITRGKLKIHRIVAGSDSGHVVNPQQVEAQIEGSFVYGLTAMLYGECTVKNGRIEQENFDTYPMLRMDEMPKVESVLVPSGGFWGGVGEPTIAVAAPAVLNAIAAATGKRVRSFPLKNQPLA